MSPYTKRKLRKNIEARVLPFFVISLIVVASITAVVVIQPSNDNTVRAASIDQFSYYKEITFDHDQVPSTQTNFPVLINISSDTDLASDALDSGWDIAFFNSTTASATQYNHEIELFNGTTGQLVAWVNITTLAHDADTKIYMYYGDSDIGSSAEDVTGTWDSNYLAVWHMTQDNATHTFDSTSNSWDLKASGSPTFTYDSMFGDCYLFNGTSDYFYRAYQSEYNVGSFTIEAWGYSEDVSSGRVIATYDDAWYLWQYSVSPNKVLLGIHGQADCFSETNDVNTWNYHVGSYDDTNIVFYKNGKTMNTTASGNYPDSSDSFYVGVHGVPIAQYWDGRLDEIRWSDIDRSADWVKTSFNSMNNGTDGGFFTLGSEEGNVEGTYTISGLNVDTRFTHSGLAGNTNISTLVMSIFTNTSGTTDNCTDIFLDFSGGYPSGYSASNFSFQVRNTSDGTFSTDWNTVTGNMTLNSTTWAGAWAYGTNPFPITGYNSTIEVRMRVVIPNSATVGTNTTDAWLLKWKVTS